MGQAFSERIYKLLEPTLNELGYTLWGIQLGSGGRKTLLRVFIDTPQGVTLADCETASRQLAAVLDVENPISGQYTLEVSSPGLDRPLFTLEQYQHYVGKTIRLRLYAPKEGRRNWVGILTDVQDSKVVLESEKQKLTVLFDEIEKANLVPEFEGRP